LIVVGNIEQVLKVFRAETRATGLTSELKIRSIAKKSERKKAKRQIAQRRRKQAEKRRTR
jgi:ribosomal protein S21